MQDTPKKGYFSLRRQKHSSTIEVIAMWCLKEVGWSGWNSTAHEDPRPEVSGKLQSCQS